MSELQNTPEQEEPINTLPVVYVSVPEEKLRLALYQNELLRRQNEELKADIASLFIPATFVLKRMGKSKNPLKLVTFFTDMVMHPDKYKPLMRPFTTIINKYSDIREKVEAEMEKVIAKMDAKDKIKKNGK